MKKIEIIISVLSIIATALFIGGMVVISGDNSILGGVLIAGGFVLECVTIYVSRKGTESDADKK
nr:hypothetical protein [Clostridia bacterium]